jgi:flagellar motor switch protein FliN/FliY
MSSSQNSSSSSDRGSAPLVALHDVVCTIDVILGSASMSVRECLALQPGSIISLAEAAGGDMEVAVNGITVAYGEVMIVEDDTAIRITDIVPPPSSEIVQ